MKKYWEAGYGGLGMLIAGLIAAVVLYFLIFPNKFPHFVMNENADNFFCKPDIEDNGDIKPDAPTITAPSYEYNPDSTQQFPIIHQDNKSYRLIKANVPIVENFVLNYFRPEDLHTQTPNTVKCPTTPMGPGPVYHHHFCQWVHEPIKVTSPFSKTEQYAVLYPATYSQSTAQESIFYTNDQQRHELLFSTYQLLFLAHLKNDKSLDTYPGLWPDPNDIKKIIPTNWTLLDVYQQVLDTDPIKPFKPLPEEVLSCAHPPQNVLEQLFSSTIFSEPSQQPSKDHKQLQLQWFVIERLDGEFNWFFPACKPAINLYPTKDTLVNVKVAIPNGFLTYTDPLYPQSTGWNVLAKPSGELHYLNNNLADSKGSINYPSNQFPYLYYEGKIQDTMIAKPNTGFVKAFNELPTFFDELLPKLGLNQKETTEFKQYWLKALPKSPYYYIGIIPQDQLDQNEPLTISPRQDTMIRIRLLFKQLDHPESFQEPVIQTPQRNGFTVVDWGAYVKQDKNHLFTCVQ